VDGLPIEPEVRAVHAAARERLAAAGAHVTDLEPDLAGADEVFETYRSLAMVAMADEVAAHPEGFKETVRWNVEQGLALTARQISRAAALRTALYRRTAALLGEYDVLALPVTQVAPFAIDLEYPAAVDGVPGESYIAWMRACSRISATTLPAISVPAGFTPGGLPLGLQLVGAPRGDLALLELAEAVQDLLGAGRVRPSAFG
jgi:amidase